ncbi:helix-turn-helix domain-containing protein [Algoriphagus lacus]|nr:AraC family transcriptional regulator [Algoriphagus lacus]
MDSINYTSKSNIFFSCTEKAYRSVESNVPEHVAIHVFSGSLGVADSKGTYLIKQGETALFYRNMLARFVKYPSEKTPFKSVAIAFSQSFLAKFYSAQELSENYVPKMEVQRIKKHPLISSLFDSILPYEDLEGDSIPKPISDLKLQEAISILRTVDIRTDNLLANFAEQGKLDLVDYMQKNFTFNIPLERFAYLTGRSLATFKRDFEKAFQSTPQKWLLEKRLQEAHFLISRKKQKPSEVYLEVGFENLSHFSRTFKNHFGYNPSTIELSY